QVAGLSLVLVECFSGFWKSWCFRNCELGCRRRGTIFGIFARAGTAAVIKTPGSFSPAVFLTPDLHKISCWATTPGWQESFWFIRMAVALRSENTVTLAK